MNNIWIKKIKELKKGKNAIILAHYYQESEIQDIADFVGDSLALAQKAMDTKADIIVLAGVHFMAETAKILNPAKKVLLPAPDAGCSLADSCPADAFEDFVMAHPEYTVVSYVNTTAAVKALTDIVCTSSNALQIIESLPKDEKIIFAPDRNLGDYIKRLTNREMLIWNGACHVHEAFSLERILELKKQHPEAKILAHPECPKPVLIVADHIGSTAALLKFSQTDTAQTYIVATESGILHQMQKASPAKTFIPAPPNDSTCACNDCRYMKLVTLQKIYDCLENESPEIILDKDLCAKAEKSILRMMEISKKLKLI
ncbi:MAG: quinolinate synthase NadA [Bacteroidales bacterium]|jgi:quinolinate synthase|nr:quinolinate synthase NadA [Bacteroidales bacterium]